MRSDPFRCGAKGDRAPLCRFLWRSAAEVGALGPQLPTMLGKSSAGESGAPWKAREADEGEAHHSRSVLEEAPAPLAAVL